MSSLVFLGCALTAYLFLAIRTRDWLAPSALLCLFWFGAASLADIAALKDRSLQRPWETETYAAIYLCGLSMFTGGLLQGRRRAAQPIQSEPSAEFRSATTALMLLSIAAVAARLYVFGFSLEQLIPDVGGADLKTDTDAIPGVFYFEIMDAVPEPVRHVRTERQPADEQAPAHGPDRLCAVRCGDLLRHP